MFVLSKNIFLKSKVYQLPGSADKGVHLSAAERKLLQKKHGAYSTKENIRREFEAVKDRFQRQGMDTQATQAQIENSFQKQYQPVKFVQDTGYSRFYGYSTSEEMGHYPKTVDPHKSYNQTYQG